MLMLQKTYIAYFTQIVEIYSTINANSTEIGYYPSDAMNRVATSRFP